MKNFGTILTGLPPMSVGATVLSSTLAPFPDLPESPFPDLPESPFPPLPAVTLIGSSLTSKHWYDQKSEATRGIVVSARSLRKKE
jgi:hypothetical protein